MGRFPGTLVLVLVVGPSGAGKDTILNGARRLLADDPRFFFPRRAITRPADAGGEDHIAVSDQDYDAILAHDGFALHWQAHGLRYGISRGIERDLALNRSVVVNASRTMIETAQHLYPGTQAIFVTASPQVLAERLAARNRETHDAILARLNRKTPLPTTGDGIWHVRNDGTADTAINAFVAILKRIVLLGSGTGVSSGPSELRPFQ